VQLPFFIFCASKMHDQQYTCRPIPHTWSLNVGYSLVPDKMCMVPMQVTWPEITFHGSFILSVHIV